MNAIVGDCHSPEQNTLQYLIPVCSSIEGNMVEACEVIRPSGFGSYHWHNHGTRTSLCRPDNCTSSGIKVGIIGLMKVVRKAANTTSSLVERIGP